MTDSIWDDGLNLVVLICAMIFSMPIYVAYSGGLDSQVLLHLLCQWRNADPAFTFEAIHVNHGLNQGADQWQAHCEQTCLAWQVPLQVLSIDLSELHGHSLEAYARQKRYKAMQSVMPKGACLLTAHHQDDQIETLLLALMRGAGPAGLSAMPSSKALGWQTLLRPLLNCSQQALLLYARKHTLDWVEDESNQDESYDRNFLRQSVLPLLRTRWPSVNKTLARATTHQADVLQVLDYEGMAAYQQCQRDKGKYLSVSALNALPRLLQQAVFRTWLRRQHLPLPSKAQTIQALHDCLTASADASPESLWEKDGIRVCLRRYRDFLCILPGDSLGDAQGWQVDWVPELDVVLPLGLGVIQSDAIAAALGACKKSGEVSVRFRQDSDTVSLKKRFQSRGIPPWERDTTPLLCVDGRVVSVLQPAD